MQPQGPFFCIFVGSNVDGAASGMPVVVVASRMSSPSFVAVAEAVEHVVELLESPSVVTAELVAANSLFAQYSTVVVCRYHPLGSSACPEFVGYAVVMNLV